MREKTISAPIMRMRPMASCRLCAKERDPANQDAHEWYLPACAHATTPINMLPTARTIAKTAIPTPANAETTPAMRYFANPSVCHSKKTGKARENAMDEAWTRFAPAGMCI